MTKSKLVSLISMTLLGSTAYAGGAMMVPAATPDHSYFAIVEGGYTWDSVGRTRVNGITASKSDHGGTGRIAAGMTHWCNSMLGYTGEMGWGYYDKTTFKYDNGGIDAENQIYGVDFLLGAVLKYDQFDLALKAGAMIQNIRMERNTNVQLLVAGSTVPNVSKSTTTDSYAVPEIKISAAYNFDCHWALSLAYMYVIGNGDVDMTINKSLSGGSIQSYTSYTGGPVSLHSLMLGLQYSFA